ncbi:RNA polymerase II-associated protein 3 [Procambarus clarkii]|uniref:RNA polymerase II-associated protein 3 n=1 Tax=Procambarus clarkii TaxID=6728 RepID=UPI001E6770BB|nr:RNA polymerase II-associated protein 3-like [Procambarus clarkii]
MEGASPLLLQKSIKDNSAALQDFIKDLNDWEKEIKNEDEKLSSQSKERGHLSPEAGPPVRSKKKLEISSGKGATENIPGDSKRRKNEKKKMKPGQKISAYDYAAWDKFDVDKELASSSEEEQNMKGKSSKHGGETIRPKSSNVEKALALKEAGNKLYNDGRLDDAAAKYTRGISLDPTNAVLRANRAMAYIKLKKYKAAEDDCNMCLKLDAGYIKGYLRRATSRINLGKTELAIKDYQKVLELEPWNKEAKKELDKLKSFVDIKGERTKKSDHEIVVKENNFTPENSSPVEELIKQETENTHHPNQNNKIQDNTLSNNKQEKGGTKLKIVEVNSSEDSSFNIVDPDCVLPIEKPPHLRSLKPLKKIPVVDVATKESICKQSVSPVAEEPTLPKSPVSPVAEEPTLPKSPVLPVAENTTVQKDLNVEGTVEESLCEATQPSKCEEKMPMNTSLPALPRTSYQFIQEWNKLSHQVSRTVEYLKIIPPAFFSTVDIESETLVNVVSALRSEEVSPTLAAEYLLALSKSRGFSINIAFLDDSQRKVICDVILKCEEAEAYSTPIKNLKNLIDKEL